MFTRTNKRFASRMVAVVVAAAAASVAVPAVAEAAPIVVAPGVTIPVPDLPQLELPKLPKLPGQPSKPKPKPKPTPESTPDQPGVPAIPNVSTRTGYIALADDASHTIYWWKDGQFLKSMPISMGSDAHPTPNGIYHTKEKYRDMFMDSSTYGVPIDSPEGYRTYVEYATRMDNSGIFIHAAPWSVAQQGVSNASHGCINVSTENGKWVYDNVGSGTPIVVRGTIGGGNQNTVRS